DLQSLLNYGEESEVSSTLMLVSGGAKVLRVKKAAFFAQASPQALDNTRTLSSKKRNPSEEVILDSYKSKLIWDEFKARLVKSLVGRGAGDLSGTLKNKQHKRRNKIQHQILTPQIQVTSEPGNCNSSDDDTNKADEQYDSHRLVPTKKPTMRRPSNYYEEIESVAKKEMVIIRRCPSAVRQHLRIARPIKSATHSPSVSSSLG
ncbi:uncharacterized protein LOC131943741, partial [Physella acuta]|uniref:uncharacterized protein LOC131943741 n=1 Tax=Physella acuta TaxID=109671 RepID=UPI0027DC20E5